MKNKKGPSMRRAKREFMKKFLKYQKQYPNGMVTKLEDDGKGKTA
jgi:hypothetical protein